MELKFNLSEDIRISKLLRRLNIEEDSENSLAISKKLLEVLLNPDNALYIRKAFHILRESISEILCVAPGPAAKCQAARALGRMGHIMGQGNDFDRFHSWLFSNINSSPDNLKYLFMVALQETLALERDKLVLQKHSATLMRNIVSTIEATDNVEVFKTGLQNLVDIVELYPNNFFPLFRDTIDLLFGWHVDNVQKLSTIEFISHCMQRLAKYFQVNMEFSMTLIVHFMEDIEGYSNQICEHESSDDESDNDNTVEHVTVFVLALNTVLKCLGNTFRLPNEHVSVKFITECLTKIVHVTTGTLESFLSDNLIIASNECVSILLSVICTKSTTITNTVLTLIEQELLLLNEFNNATVISALLMISTAVKELSANLPAELIPKLIGPSSEIIKLRYSKYIDVQEAVIGIYQSLLNLKNVPLLQEAYRYILGDLELVYRHILPEIAPFCMNNPFVKASCQEYEAETTVIFLLRCLSPLANSSIIGMWALNPSLLELLGVLMECHSNKLSLETPVLQYSLLYLLFSYCRCYNYFISCSSLVTYGLPENWSVNDVNSTRTPNSGNFKIVLDVLYKTLTTITKLDTETVLLVLNWFKDVLHHAKAYLEVLYAKVEFVELADVVLKCGYTLDVQIALAVCENLSALLENKHLSWKNSFLANIVSLCSLHMISNNETLRDCYSKLSVNVPWDVTIKEFGKMYKVDEAKRKYNGLDCYNNYTVVLAQHMHVYGSVYGEMLPLHFKSFTNYLLKGDMSNSNWLEDVFLGCWPIESDISENGDQFKAISVCSRSVMENWATWEAAQFCVNTKLRTPLGKPNETFTSFEVALKDVFKHLLKGKGKIPDDGKVLQIDRNHIRTFLLFMNHLEISIYNASEGSAIVLPQSSKPVRTFFTTNYSTCREWLSRIRITLIQLSLHAGLPALALRHGTTLLKELKEAKKTNGIEFCQVVIYIALSLVNMHEGDALNGFSSWCKKVTGKDYTWIKFAAEQANNRFEIAASGYKNILCSERITDDEASENLIRKFISEQLVNCYKQINDWFDIIDHRAQAVEWNMLGDTKYSFESVNFECVQAIYDSEVGHRAFAELNTWPEKKSWSVYDTLCKVETDVHNVALNIVEIERKHALGILDNCLGTIHCVMQEELLTLPSDSLETYSVLMYVAHGLKNVLNNILASSVFLVSENFEKEVGKISSSVLSKILWWSEFFAKLQNQGFNMFCSNLRLNVIKKARKEKNFNLATNHLYVFLQEKDVLYMREERSGNVLNNIVSHSLKKIPDMPIWCVDNARCVYELIKLSYVDTDSRQLTFDLCAVASTAISKHAEMYSSNELKQVSGKILLKLATWLQNGDQACITDFQSPLGKFLTVLPELNTVEKSNIVPLTEMAIGKLLQFGVHECNGLAKSWNAFGTWCYRWGKKVVDTSAEITNVLTKEDELSVRNLLPSDTKLEDLKRVYMILSQTRVSVDEEDIDSTDINTSEMIRCQLQNVPVLFNAHESVLQDLVQIWRNVHKRVYVYYELSAEAYFKYLNLSVEPDNITKETESSSVTITLRLLRLVVKHALELQNVLDKGLASTPTQPWKIIIPQLFSRLNHPENYVRQRVSELLCRVAVDAPHLIMFPAVVGALEGGMKFDFSEISLPKDCLSQNNDNNDDTDDEIDDSYDSENDDSKSVLQSCFKSMVDTLSKQAPETINEVQLLVKELRRIILLWDELWLGTLAQHHGEINKRQQQLETEIEKVVANPNLTHEEKISLIAEKHRIIIKPIIYILEQLNDITSVEPETPHEKRFQEQYSEIITETLRKLKNPDNVDKPQESWHLLKQLQNKMQQKINKRASYTLKMQDISPMLANMRHTVISMPGLTSPTNTNVTIHRVSNQVSILLTKTKPKKLAFHGSDGQTYTYLFKGLEDLHLDERIMQFLSITNTMMAQNTACSDNLYRARHYSVIPLGPRSGLISWVDGTTPIFALYKRWQQRQAIKMNARSGNNGSQQNVTVLRPSELFYNKLKPLLQEHGVKSVEYRKECPLSVLKQVLVELMNETPSDLLAKELWCHSVNAGTWWQMVRRYSYSVAVMSIIGYIIGLGDRHLDNMLVDLTSGDVVHIDYNVCFEKGKALRVPEKVPFRLTPNLCEALGVTGVEVSFCTFLCICVSVFVYLCICVSVYLC